MGKVAGQVLVSNGLLGCPFMPDLLHNIPKIAGGQSRRRFLFPIVCMCFVFDCRFKNMFFNVFLDVTQFFAYKSSLVAIFWCFDTPETWPGRGGIGWFNSGVEWPSGMPIHARFTPYHLPGIPPRIPGVALGSLGSRLSFFCIL